MDNAVLNSELIATKAGDVTVYNYNGETALLNKSDFG